MIETKTCFLASKTRINRLEKVSQIVAPLRHFQALLCPPRGRSPRRVSQLRQPRQQSPRCFCKSGAGAVATSAPPRTPPTVCPLERKPIQFIFRLRHLASKYWINSQFSAIQTMQTWRICPRILKIFAKSSVEHDPGWVTCVTIRYNGCSVWILYLHTAAHRRWRAAAQRRTQVCRELSKLLHQTKIGKIKGEYWELLNSTSHNAEGL